MENMLTATLAVELRYLDTAGRRVKNSKTFTVTGAGFDQPKAFEAAVRNARPQIEALIKAAT
jgi:hypothetical protein